VTGRVRVCVESGGANYSHVVKETLLTDIGQELKTLNIIMIDAYLYDNVDYFFVQFGLTKTTDIILFDRGFHVAIR